MSSFFKQKFKYSIKIKYNVLLQVYDYEKDTYTS